LLLGHLGIEELAVFKLQSGEPERKDSILEV
jgi:hypothetical protein